MSRDVRIYVLDERKMKLIYTLSFTSANLQLVAAYECMSCL